MDISRVISIVRTLKEQPTNSAGENGFSNAANAAVQLQELIRDFSLQQLMI